MYSVSNSPNYIVKSKILFSRKYDLKLLVMNPIGIHNHRVGHQVH